MTVAFDEKVQERDCTVIFKFNGEFNICVTVIEVVQKLSCCVFTVEQGESIISYQATMPKELFTMFFTNKIVTLTFTSMFDWLSLSSHSGQIQRYFVFKQLHFPRFCCSEFFGNKQIHTTL